MFRKISMLVLAMMVIMLIMVSTTLAQTYYGIVNNSAVAVTISLQVNCPGPPPLSYITAGVVAPANTAIIIPISSPPCSVSYVIVNGTSYYPMRYNGPLNPPNPPVWISVTSNVANIW